MNKSVYSLAAMLLLGLGVAGAEVVPVPVSQTGVALNSADYGGYLVSTSAFSNSATTITIPAGFSEIAIAAIVYSSGPGEAFTQFRSSDGYSDGLQPFLRVYNSSDALSGVSTGGTIKKVGPVRSRKNVHWTPSSAGFNLISVLYTLK